MLIRVTPVAVLMICCRMLPDRKRCFANSGSRVKFLLGRKQMQKLLRYNGVRGGDVTTDVSPTSSLFSEDPVKSMSPIRRVFCVSESLILTKSSAVTSTWRFEYTFLYDTYRAVPSTKSALVFPVKPPSRWPTSPSDLYSTPPGQRSRMRSSMRLTGHRLRGRPRSHQCWLAALPVAPRSP